jgi:hypothetical protein
VARQNAENDFVGEQTVMGRLGVGTTAPSANLEVRGADPALRIRNSNDTIGGWLGDSGNTLQLGMYNPTANAVGVVGANSSRAFFGIDGATGRVGSLTNNFGSPAFRVVLDDGNGNMTFGATTRQMLNLWNTNYGIGVQNNTQYYRTDGGFAWYRGGLHNNTEGSPGTGGTALMKLSAAGDLDFNNMPGLHFGQSNSGPPLGRPRPRWTRSRSKCQPRASCSSPVSRACSIPSGSRRILRPCDFMMFPERRRSSCDPRRLSAAAACTPSRSRGSFK